MKYLFFLLTASLALAQTNSECIDCHDDFNSTLFRESIHGDMECVECHTLPPGHDVDSNLVTTAVNCADCHEDAQEEYEMSVHRFYRDDADLPGAGCTDCHGTHNIFSYDDKNSTIYKLNIEKTCGNCHGKPEVLARLGFRGMGPVGLYKSSVHARILHRDTEKDAPTCITCHGYHSIVHQSDDKCLYNKRHLSSTCGQCHEKEQEAYQQSIHWQAINRGHMEAPTCNDCHGEHQIMAVTDSLSGAVHLNFATQTCKNCHSSPVMMKRFGLDPRRLESYERSYHGLAVLKGSPDAATCTSCHEVHAIKSSRDSTSSISAAHLEETCGQCHRDVSESFTRIVVHPLDQKERNPVAWFFRTLYLWLIFIIIGGMLTHNIIILLYFIRERRRQRRSEGPLVQRFQPFEVYQHFFLILSFSVLALTGFALRFPQAAWVELLVNLGMTETVRANLHRVAAVLMIIISLVQAWYLLFTPRGKREMKSLLPTLRDVKDLWENIAFHLGLKNRKPEFDRFSYVEKAEYLALIWGIILMSLSGLILWFPEFFIYYLPVWSFETAEVIHYYEAWLATLAILVWHWFFVIFHPHVYPMNLTWTDGKISEHEMKKEHMLEYKRMKRLR